MHWEYVILLSNIGSRNLERYLYLLIVACLIKIRCMLTNSLTASNYLCNRCKRWVLAGSGYLLVGSW